jgi:hypothetical protein
MPAIIVRGGPSAGQRVEVMGEFVLGRAENDFLQHDTEVSRRHAVVRLEEGGLLIEDLGSSNGTFVNDRRIEGVERLSSGDTVRVGQTSLEVEIEPAQQPTVIRETVAAPPEPGPEATVAPSEPPPMPTPTPAEFSQEPTAPQPPVPPAAAPPQEPPAQPPPTPQPAPPPLPEPPAAEPPPSPPPAGPPPFAAPPAAAPAQAYGQPPGAYAYGGGARPGSVVAAAIVLILIGLGSIIYNGYDMFLLFGDLELLRQIGRSGLGIILIVLDAVIIIGGVLMLIGGIRLFGLSRAGRTLGLVGCGLVIVGWLGFLVVAMSEGLTLNALAWSALVLSVAGAVLAGALLLAAGRAFAPRY